MAKNNGLGLDQNKGTFEYRGIVTGVGKDKFYTEKKAKNDKPWRNVQFGLRISKDEQIFLQFNGMPQEKVFYYSRDDKKTEPVDWKERYSFKRKGYSLIGMNIGLEKTTDEKGNEVNNKKYLVAFDAAEYVSEHLRDGMSVFVKGNIEYSHFTRNEEVVRSVKYVPNQISLCKEINFDATDEKGNGYEIVANFTQPLVFMGIEKEEDRFLLQGTIVNYSTIENAEFVVENDKLAKNFRKLKPYTFIKTWGNIRTEKNTDQVEVETADDGWGEGNKMDRQFAPYKVYQLITGADPASMDTEKYSEKNIEKALEEMKKAEKKEKQFESAKDDEDDWGSKGSSDEDDDDSTPW